jgi:hypothetical protein
MAMTLKASENEKEEEAKENLQKNNGLPLESPRDPGLFESFSIMIGSSLK